MPTLGMTLISSSSTLVTGGATPDLCKGKLPHFQWFDFLVWKSLYIRIDLLVNTDGTWFNQAILITKTWTVSSQWRKHFVLGHIGSKLTLIDPEHKSCSSPFLQHTTSNLLSLVRLNHLCLMFLKGMSWHHLYIFCDWSARVTGRHHRLQDPRTATEKQNQSQEQLTQWAPTQIS